MRILHVVNKLNERGDGIANVCVDLACEQASLDSSVAIACAEGGFVPLVTQNGVRHFPLDLIWRTPTDLVRSVRSVRRAIDAFAPDILHAHTMRAVLVARLARPRRGPRVVATVHNEYQRGVFLMGLAHRVVGVSTAVSGAMRSRGISARRISTVPNGIVGSARRTGAPPSPTGWQAPQALASQSIIAIGAVSERKGADVLIDAFDKIAAEFPYAELYFIGNVDWDEAPRRAAASNAGGRIHFLGFHSEPQLFLREATVFALASRRDPFPLVLLEALETGTPIVASDVDGIPEALAGGDAGILVPVDDPVALGAAIARLLESEALREQYGRAARARSQAYSVAKMTSGYATIYDEVTAGSG